MVAIFTLKKIVRSKKRMRSAPFMGPAANFFVLNTRNYRWFVTHGVLGMNIEGTSTLQNFRAYTPTLGGSFTISPNSGKKTWVSEKKRNTRKIDIAVDRTENTLRQKNIAVARTYRLMIRANKQELSTFSNSAPSYQKQYPDVKENVRNLSIKMTLFWSCHTRRPIGRILNE